MEEGLVGDVEIIFPNRNARNFDGTIDNLVVSKRPDLPKNAMYDLSHFVVYNAEAKQFANFILAKSFFFRCIHTTCNCSSFIYRVIAEIFTHTTPPLQYSLMQPIMVTARGRLPLFNRKIRSVVQELNR